MFETTQNVLLRKNIDQTIITIEMFDLFEFCFSRFSLFWS